MRLPRPHSITWQPLLEAVDDEGIALAESYGDATELAAFVQPMESGIAQQITGLVMQRPFKVFVELADADGIKSGDKITYDSEEFFVAAPVKKWKGAGIDYAILIVHDKDGDE